MTFKFQNALCLCCVTVRWVIPPLWFFFKETEKADRHLNQIHHYGEAQHCRVVWRSAVRHSLRKRNSQSQSKTLNPVTRWEDGCPLTRKRWHNLYPTLPLSIIHVSRESSVKQTVNFCMWSEYFNVHGLVHMWIAFFNVWKWNNNSNVKWAFPQQIQIHIWMKMYKLNKAKHHRMWMWTQTNKERCRSVEKLTREQSVD